MQVNNAIEPSTSATVSASAGTGKTWSLVSRLIRLLIDGAEPGSILAITFTRKAAAEMQARLNERLLELASCDQDRLEQQLQLIGAPLSESSFNVARQLYERILYASYPPRITTFHAMCQELLKRFPFDANVPPGFELVEQTADLENEAMDLLFTEATLSNDGPVAGALELLFHYGNGISNTRLALENFLRHRSDWWAYTANQKDPEKFAAGNLKKQLGIENEEASPEADVFTANLLGELKELSDLLARHVNKTNQDKCKTIYDACQLAEEKLFLPAFELLIKVFFTEKGDPRKTKTDNKAQIKSMGEQGNQRFLKLHEHFVEKITAVLDMRARLNTYQVSSAWFTAGQRLLTNYQNIKSEQRILDFPDLEWYAYLLLSDESHAAWIQYKLDSRINHVLIDEYQDTNPTQWHLLRPLLEEICSSKTDNGRSIFLVGDTKQSIYRFRRAQPELFKIAKQWMNSHIDCVDASLDMSRRSAPAIINFVNAVFDEGSLREQIVDFEPHGTHLKNLWGKVTVVPLFADDDDSAENQDNEEPEHDTKFRNPLLTPSIKDEEQRRADEARFIATEIQKLISTPTIVGQDATARALKYSDIILLMRQRTHAGIYETALNAANIPYVGISKGTLLETLEIRDLSALLNTLITPFDNLALAQVLKSPIFGCSDQELLLLAGVKNRNWFDRLIHLSEKNPQLPTLKRAVKLLTGWKAVAGKLPVHDLLDRIISESNLINRYINAYPDHLKLSVESNLNRFIELALEIDSGRYPSIARFLHRLALLRDNQNDAPDELPAGKHTDRVRLMTIHSAKGLEAPVIFLTDASNTPSSKEAYHAVVDWPAAADKPNHFLLALRKGDQDQTVRQIFSSQLAETQRENANLLYVALTRAKQLLYVTGSQSRKFAGKSWYDDIRTQLETHADECEITDDGCFVFSSNQMPADIVIKPVSDSKRPIETPAALSKPFSSFGTNKVLTPSLLAQDKPEEFEHTQRSNIDARERGVMIHKILQLLTKSTDRAQCRKQVDSLFAAQTHAEHINKYWEEAQAIVDDEKFKHLFNATCFERAYNEVPVQYNYGNFTLHGIIDRLVVSENTAYIIDYKTARQNLPSEELAHAYSPQMSIYYHGIQKLWPEKKVVPLILQTAYQTTLETEVLDMEKLIACANANDGNALSAGN